MRPHRAVNAANVARTAIPLLAVAAVLSLSAGAQAATVSQKIYKILTNEYKAQIAYSATEMQANVTTAQTKLASTASSIDALSYSNNSAATALVDELENQYDAAGAAGLFKPALTAFTAIGKLPIKGSEHKNAVADEATVKRILAINTPADLASWQAAGYAPASEPADTKTFGGFFGISLPTIGASFTGPIPSVKTLNKLATKANHLANADFSALSSDWQSWAAGFGIVAG
jgi:hypothetical protein